MQLTKLQTDIIQAKICAYCHEPTQYVDSIEIYKQSYGMVYWCEFCGAHVGVHKGTNKALGRVANKELREWKIKAHDAFDVLWKDGLMHRKTAYRLLSENLNIPKQYTHIGYFGIETCKKVIEISNRIHKWQSEEKIETGKNILHRKRRETRIKQGSPRPPS